LIRPIIIKYGLESHLVEPIKENFELLVKNYLNYSNVFLYNFAISDIDGFKEITTITYDESLPIWCKGLSTFDASYNFFSGFGGFKLKEDLRDTELFKIIDKKRNKVVVETKTLKSFLTEKNIDKIDIFITDTEGHDFIIFSQLDLVKYSPKYIIMETHTLSEETNKLIVDKLTHYNYSIIENGWDIIAIKK
jgi:FkbM family methyltransferase